MLKIILRLLHVGILFHFWLKNLLLTKNAKKSEFSHKTIFCKCNFQILTLFLFRIAIILIHLFFIRRLQTVSKESEPWFYSLLSEIGKRNGGYEMLINTSFNIKVKKYIFHNSWLNSDNVRYNETLFGLCTVRHLRLACIKKKPRTGETI